MTSTAETGSPRNAIETARGYIRRGLAVIPIPDRVKGPTLPGWQRLRLTEDDLPIHFNADLNIGVLNGEPSGNLADVDLDTAAAVACAPAFLPATNCIFGRQSRPRSHYCYRTDGKAPKTEQFSEPAAIGRGATLVELRSTGSQTVWPGSQHPEGEFIRFDVDGDPVLVDADELRRCVARVAICSLIARHWPTVHGTRHQIANALGGFLLRHGVEESMAVAIVETAAQVAHDEESSQRGAAVCATAETLRQGEPATGGPTLAELLDEKVVAAVASWLGSSASVVRASSGVGAGTCAAKSQATQLIALAESAEFFHTPDGVGYVTLPVTEHWETWPVKSKAFHDLLAHRFYEQTGVAPKAAALEDALGVLEGKAVHGGDEIPVFTRLAEIDGKVYLDLVNDRWEVVEITSAGWRVIQDRTIKFRRSRGMLSLPQPVAGGSIEELRPFLNVARDNDWVLIVAWLIGAFRPTGPFPVLALHGEQGSAKSTTAKVVKKLVDPNKADLRGEPKNAQDIMIAATNGWVIAFDNLDRIRAWLSNVLCRLATGGAFTTRKLYTDDQEALFDAQRPLILTGIAEVATRADLLDRCLIVELPAIPESRRRPESEFWHEFEIARPRILGALLNTVVTALSNLPTTRLSRLPRLADFAIWATAAEAGLGWSAGTFLRAYSENRAAADQLVLDDPVVDALRGLLASSQGRLDQTASELLAALNGPAGASEEIKKQRGWPKNGRALSGRLHRLIPSLRAAGVQVEFTQTSGSRSRKRIAITLAGSCDASDASRMLATQHAGGATQLRGPATQPASHEVEEEPVGVEGADDVAKMAA